MFTQKKSLCIFLMTCIALTKLQACYQNDTLEDDALKIKINKLKKHPNFQTSGDISVIDSPENMNSTHIFDSIGVLICQGNDTISVSNATIISGRKPNTKFLMSSRHVIFNPDTFFRQVNFCGFTQKFDGTDIVTISLENVVKRSKPFEVGNDILFLPLPPETELLAIKIDESVTISESNSDLYMASFFAIENGGAPEKILQNSRVNKLKPHINNSSIIASDFDASEGMSGSLVFMLVHDEVKPLGILSSIPEKSCTPFHHDYCRSNVTLIPQISVNHNQLISGKE